jgi:hypothetical protein
MRVIVLYIQSQLLETRLFIRIILGAMPGLFLLSQHQILFLFSQSVQFPFHLQGNHFSVDGSKSQISGSAGLAATESEDKQRQEKRMRIMGQMHCAQCYSLWQK